MVNERNAGNEDKPATGAGAASHKRARGSGTQAREPAKSSVVHEPPRTPAAAKGSEVTWEALASEAPWSKKAAMAKRAAPVHPGTPEPRRATRSADELGSNPWRNHRGSGSGHGAANQNEGKQGFRTVTSSAVWPHLAPTVPASGGTEGRAKDVPTPTAAQAKSQTPVAEKQKPESRSDEEVAGPAPVSPAQPKIPRQAPDADATTAPLDTAKVPGKTPRPSKRKPARYRETGTAAPTAAKACVTQKGPAAKETPRGAASQMEASAGASAKATPAEEKPRRKASRRPKARPVETPSPEQVKAIPVAPRDAAAAKPAPTPKVRVAQKGPAEKETPRGAAPQVEASAGASEKAAPAEEKPKRRPQRRPKARPVETPSPEQAKAIPEAPRDAAAAKPAPTPGAKAADAAPGLGTRHTQVAEAASAGHASRALASGREGQPTRPVPAPNMQFRPMPVEGLGNGIVHNPWRNHRGSGPSRGGAIQSVAKLGSRTVTSSVVWPHLAPMPRVPASGGTQARGKDAPRPGVAEARARPGAGSAAEQAKSQTPLAEKLKPEVRAYEEVAEPAPVSPVQPEPKAPRQAQDEGETPAPVDTAEVPGKTPGPSKREPARPLETDTATAAPTAVKVCVAQQGPAAEETPRGAAPQVEASVGASEKAAPSHEQAEANPVAQRDAAAAKPSPTPGTKTADEARGQGTRRTQAAEAADSGHASSAPASGREGQPTRPVATPNRRFRQIRVEGLGNGIGHNPWPNHRGSGPGRGAANQTEAKLGFRTVVSSEVRPHLAPTVPASGGTEGRTKDTPRPAVAAPGARPVAGSAAAQAKLQTPLAEKLKPEVRSNEEVARPAPVSSAQPEVRADEAVAEPAPVSPVQPEARAVEEVAGPALVSPAQPEARSDEAVAEPAPVSPAQPEARAVEEVAGLALVSPAQPEARADEDIAGPAPVSPAQPEARADEDVAGLAPVSPAQPEARADEDVAGPAPVLPAQPEARANQDVAEPAPVSPAQPEPKAPRQAQDAGETPAPVGTTKVPGKAPEPTKGKPTPQLEMDPATAAPTAAKVRAAQQAQAEQETQPGAAPQVEASAGVSEKAAPSPEQAKAIPVAQRDAAAAKPSPTLQAADAGHASCAPASGREGQPTRPVATPDIRFRQIPVEGLGNGIVNTLGDGLGYAIDTAKSATHGVASGVSWGISVPGRLASKLRRHGATADKD